MFLEFYGLREQPFGVTPNPRFMYASPSHREVLASLLYAIQSDLGFSALIADPGMGKTTLLFDLLERYRNTANTAFLFNTQCNSRDLLRHLLSELGVDSDGRDQFSMHEKFKEVLLQSARDGKKVLIILDEAHNLDVSVLETIRLLSNFETSDAKLMHIILAGQIQLANKLMSPGMAQLYQRISIVSRIKPLTSEETFAYIDHRLEVAGYNSVPLFSAEALDKIAQLSAGVPRTINRLCLASMSIGCALNQRQIQGSVVDEVSADLNLSTLLPPADQFEKKPVRLRAKSRPFAPEPDSPKEPPPVTSPISTQAEVPLQAAASSDTDPALEKIRNAVAPRPVQQRSLGKAALRAAREPTFKLPSMQWVTTALMVIVCILFIGWLTLRGFPGLSSIFAKEPEAPTVSPTVSNSTAVEEPSTAKQDDTAQQKASVSSASKGASKPVMDLMGSTAPASSAANSMHRKGTSIGPYITLPSFGEPLGVKPNTPSSGRSQVPTDPSAEDQPTPPKIQMASEESPRPLANAMGSVLGEVPKVKVETPPPPAKAEIVPGRVIQNPKPSYPQEAKRLGIEGPVVLSAVISKEGKVTEVHRVSGDPRLASAAEDAVRRWKYDPYRLNGEPVESTTEIKINFSIPQ